MVIGITGNSGSGKTTISKLMAEKMKAEIVDADKVVKELQQKGKSYYNAIISTFGDTILLENKNLDRKALAKLIFTNEIAMNKMNCLTQKYVVPEIIKKIKNSKRKNVILDVTLLFELGLDKFCNITIAVLADEQVKIERICLRDGITETVAKQRLNVQPNDEYYTKYSDYVMVNNRETNIKQEIERGM